MVANPTLVWATSAIVLCSVSDEVLDFPVIHLDWDIDLDDSFRIHHLGELSIIARREKSIGRLHLRLSGEEWIIGGHR